MRILRVIISVSVAMLLVSEFNIAKSTDTIHGATNNRYLLQENGSAVPFDGQIKFSVTSEQPPRPVGCSVIVYDEQGNRQESITTGVVSGPLPSPEVMLQALSVARK